MKLFDGRKAAEDYMSAHTLTFSTPDLTLKRFAFWLADVVTDPTGGKDGVSRLLTYMEEKDFAPVEIIDEDTYKPSGAVLGSGMYGDPTQSGDSFCGECGSKNSQGAKFCTQCGENL